MSLVSILSWLGDNRDADHPDNIRYWLKQGCVRYNLDFKIAAAVIYQESRGDMYAFRYEPMFYKRYLEGKPRKKLGGHWPASVTDQTERVGRACSWGLFQVMGQVAREQGSNVEYLPELCGPEENIIIGCRFLRWCLSQQPKTLLKLPRYKLALLRYNGGGNPNYPDEVFGHIESGVYDTIFRQAT